MSAPVQDSIVLQICTFHLGDQAFGVNVTHVQELVRAQEMTPVPLAAEAVRGLINLRGQIVTAIDMRCRLGMPPRADGQPPMNVVINNGNGAVTLLVDEIGDVVDVVDVDAEAPPETMAVGRDLIERVYKLDGQLLFLLNMDRAVQVSSRPSPERN